ncbi:hypothetical protein B0H15DRAFT_831358 [Mycena belliarum]|uniref:Uncharacterized protein n=1 Tax=Mycena belliarum TaxID=1033014 RepID=A0AAD6XT97_9AGAR|nr:hypothetical protein B0H15DRAFT_831358 [Mycena belliae]
MIRPRRHNGSRDAPFRIYAPLALFLTLASANSDRHAKPRGCSPSLRSSAFGVLPPPASRSAQASKPAQRPAKSTSYIASSLHASASRRARTTRRARTLKISSSSRTSDNRISTLSASAHPPRTSPARVTAQHLRPSSASPHALPHFGYGGRFLGRSAHEADARVLDPGLASAAPAQFI